MRIAIFLFAALGACATASADRLTETVDLPEPVYDMGASRLEAALLAAAESGELKQAFDKATRGVPPILTNRSATRPEDVAALNRGQGGAMRLVRTLPIGYDACRGSVGSERVRTALTFDLEPDGRPVNVRAEAEEPCVVPYVLKAVSGWRYYVPEVDGQPVSVRNVTSAISISLE